MNEHPTANALAFQCLVAISLGIWESKIPKNWVFKSRPSPIHFQNIQYLGVYQGVEEVEMKMGKHFQMCYQTRKFHFFENEGTGTRGIPELMCYQICSYDNLISP